MLLNSESIGGTHWNLQNSETVTLNATTAPNGQSTATKEANGGSASGAVTQQITNNSVTSPYTFSFWIQAGNSTKVSYGIYDNGTASFVGGLQSINNLSTTWQRVSVTGTPGFTGHTLVALIYADGSSSTTSGNYIYIWGAQVVQTSTAGVYTSTSGSAVSTSYGSVTNGELLVSGDTPISTGAAGTNANPVLSVTGGGGGATSGTSNIAGAGAGITLQGGIGGNATASSGTSTAGAGGSFTLQGGNGGVNSNASGTNGNGGNITLSAGAVGTGGTGGSSGSVIVKNQANTTTAFQIQNTIGATVLSTSTTTNTTNIFGNLNLSQIANASAPTFNSFISSGALTGSYYYIVTYVTSSGQTGYGPISGVSSVISPSAQNVVLNIPTSPSNLVVSRHIYRGISSSGPFNLVGTVSDNVTTTFTDSNTSPTTAANIDNTTAALQVSAFPVLIVDSIAYNTALGYSLGNNTTGNMNSSFGYNALASNTTGTNNSAFGYFALQANTTGSANTAYGLDALSSITTGFDSTAVGSSALRNTTGNYDTALGHDAGYADNGGNFITPVTVQNATAIGAFAQVQASNSVVLGSIDTATSVGIGTTIPLNTFSVSPMIYNTGTACSVASSGSSTCTGGATTFLYGSSTTWTSSMVGDELIFADGQESTISAVTSTTAITLNSALPTGESTGSFYRIHVIGLQVTSSGNLGVGTINPNGLLSVGSTSQFSVDSSGDQESIGYIDNGIGGIGQFGNMLLDSETIGGTGWSLSNGETASQNATTAPNGQTTASKIQNGGSGSAATFQQITTNSLTSPYTFSFWVMAGNSSKISYGIYDSTASAWVGALQTNNNLSTNWQRLSFTGTPGTSGHTLKAYLYADNASSTTSGNYNYVWGAQVVQASTAGVYISTTGSVVNPGYGSVTNGQIYVTGDTPVSSATAGTAANTVLTVTGGNGGNTSGTSYVAGAGAGFSLQGGVGGNATAGSGTSTAGAGGSFTLQGGNGGVNSNASGTNGNGGSITLSAGAVGTGGTGGSNGSVIIKNQANSTTAFLVQNTASSAVLDVDTTNFRVGIGTNAPSYNLQVVGSGKFSSLSNVGSPTITVIGATGATTFTYVINATDGFGSTTGGSQTITNGNATLSGSNYNQVCWTAVPGAISYTVYRTAGPNTGLLTFGITSTCYNDQSNSVMYSLSPASSNNTGSVSAQTGIFSSSLSSGPLSVTGTGTFTGSVYVGTSPGSTAGLLQVNNPYSGGTGTNGILEVGGSISSIPILFDTPGAPSVTPQGGTGSTTYSYQIASCTNCVTSFGILWNYDHSIASTATTITNGSSSLNSSTYNSISWSGIAGISSYLIYRTTGGTTSLIALVASGTNYNDQGGTPLVSNTVAPTVDTIGSIFANTNGGVYAGNIGLGFNGYAGSAPPSAVLYVSGSQPSSSSGNGTAATTAVNVQGAQGGNTSGTSNTAGAGAGLTLQGGLGGYATSGSGTSTAGAGGSFTLQGGNGGVNTSVSGTNGNGGSITLSAGSVGTGGTGGSNGSVIIKNQANSTTAFQIQNAAGATILSTDTTANTVNLNGNFNLNQVAAPSTAPTVATGVAGALTGTYYYVISYVTASGQTNYGPVSSSVAPSSQKVNLTAVPTSPSNLVTARDIYRGTALAGPFNYVGQIADNTTTTYTDNNTSPTTAADDINLTSNFQVSGNTVLIADSANYNTGLGIGVLQGNSIGTSNAALGYHALNVSTTGGGNAAFGYDSLVADTTGSGNTAIGGNSLQATTYGQSNTGVGQWALDGNTSGGNNTALGWGSLTTNSSGSDNTALGYNANVSTGALQNANAIGTAAVSGQNDSLILGTTNGTYLSGTDIQTSIGIGTSTPGSILTVTGLQPASGNAISVLNVTGGTGAGTSTAGNGAAIALQSGNGGNGSTANGSGGNITLSAGSAGSGAGSAGSAGSVIVENQSNSTTAFQIQNASGATILSTDTTANTVNLNGNLNLNQVAGPSSAPTFNSFVGSGSLTGSFYYVVSYITAAGQTNYSSVSSVISPTAQNVVLNIPVSPSNLVTGRNIYRASTSTGPYLRVGQVLNNTATTFTDSNTSPTFIASDISEAASFEINGSIILQADAATFNTDLGYQALAQNSTGQYNTAVGHQALQDNTTGSDNVGFGNKALQNNTTGSHNTAVGKYSLLSNISGSYDTALGMYAGYQDSGGNFVTGSALQNATALGAYAQVQANNSIVLGSVDTVTKVGIGTTIPLNTFSVSPMIYNTGTACSGSGSCTGASSTLFGSGTTWTTSMIGDELIFADGQYSTITAVGGTTAITLAGSVNEPTGSNYRIQTIGFNVTSSGNAYIQNTSTTAFQVQNAAGNQVFGVDTTNANVLLGEVHLVPKMVHYCRFQFY